MAVSPNSTCEAFCIWIQATPWLGLTAPQNVFVEEVKDAAASSGTVSDHVWNEFLRITGLWYQYYTAYTAQVGIVQGKWIDFSASATIIGWSSYTVKILQYCVVNEMLFVLFNIVGTSNSTSASFTLPFSIVVNNASISFLAQNNSGTPVISRAVENSSTVLGFRATAGGSTTSWAAGNTKAVQGVGIFQLQ